MKNKKRGVLRHFPISREMDTAVGDQNRPRPPTPSSGSAIWNEAKGMDYPAPQYMVHLKGQVFIARGIGKGIIQRVRPRQIDGYELFVLFRSRLATIDHFCEVLDQGGRAQKRPRVNRH